MVTLRQAPCKRAINRHIGVELMSKPANRLGDGGRFPIANPPPA